ncbi:hypothetical protein MIDIC_420008 [Alphaproteobacteria bacterium]
MNVAPYACVVVKTGKRFIREKEKFPKNALYMAVDGLFSNEK